MAGVTAVYRVLIDWGNAGTFANADRMARWLASSPVNTAENVTRNVRASPAPTTDRGRDQLRSLSPPMAGAADAELDNRTKIYSAENGLSALAGQLEPGRGVQWQAYYAGTRYYLWTGVLDDLPQHPEPGKWSVSIPALGTLSRLKGKTGLTSALYSDITTDVALGYVLDAAGLTDTSKRVFSTGRTTLRWFWISKDDDLFDLAVSIFNSEGPGANLYEDGQGRIHFEDRYYRLLTTRCLTSQATFRDTGTEPAYSAFRYDRGISGVVNIATVTHRKRAAAGSVSVIWSLGATLTLAAGEARSFVVTPSSSDPFTGALTPVAATDYTVSAGAVTPSLDRTSGPSCVLTMTAGAAGATVTGLQVRAKPVAVTYTTNLANTVDATSSIARYGKRPYSLATLDEIDLEVQQDFANAIVGQYQEPRPTVQIVLNNGDAARMTQILTRELSDRVTVIEPQTGLSTDMFVERVQHTIESGGAYHEATFGLEEAATGYWVLGESELGTTTRLGY